MRQIVDNRLSFDSNFSIDQIVHERFFHLIKSFENDSFISNEIAELTFEFTIIMNESLIFDQIIRERFTHLESNY